MSETGLFPPRVACPLCKKTFAGEDARWAHAKDIHRDLFDYVAAPPAWRDIAEAPKDGTPIILLSAPYTTPADQWSPEVYHGPRVAIGQWDREGMAWVDHLGSLSGDAHHLEKTGVWNSEGAWFQPNEVTHFMLLPPTSLPEEKHP